MLDERWAEFEEKSFHSSLTPGVKEAIKRSINAATKTYRYVLPTQLLAKAVDASLDCRSVQADSGLERSFDARSICHKVIVPFDRLNHNVLGGSTEPYVNNPLRIPAILKSQRKAQKNPNEFDDLCLVLDYAQEHPGIVLTLLDEVLHAMEQRMTEVSISYPLPNRTSLEQTQGVIFEYLKERTGGLRLQVVAVALFRCIGESFKLFNSVRSASINAADASTGSVADLECLDSEGNIVLAVEVKDQQLELRHVQDKLPGIRSKGIKEFIFLVQGNVFQEHEREIHEKIRNQFVTGQNLYICELHAFLGACLVLLGESGRRLLLRYIGEELERVKADLKHRKAWQEALSAI